MKKTSLGVSLSLRLAFLSQSVRRRQRRRKTAATTHPSAPPPLQPPSELLAVSSIPKMSQLITRRRGVTNAPPAFSAPTASAVSAPLIGEPTSLIEATPRASQVPTSSTSSVSIQPLSAQRPHRCRRRRHLKPSDHTSSTSTIKGGGSQPAKKTTKGPNRMLKPTHNVRMSKKMIKSAYDSWHRGAATSQQHSSISTSCSFVLDQKLGHHHGKVVRGMGKVRVREMGASSSRPITGQVIALKKEVETIKAKIAAQGEKIAAQGEKIAAQGDKIAAQGEKIAAQGEKLSMILRALQMSGLQIPMPAPNIAPPSTS